MNFLTTIEARINSKRLPGKVLMNFDKNNKVLNVLVNNIKKSKFVKKIIIATSSKRQNKKIVNFSKKNKIRYFQGSENNVLKRLYESTKNQKEKHIIQLTGDNPLIDFRIINFVVEKYLKNYPKYDFVTNNNLFNIKKKFVPTGMIVSVFKKSKLKTAYNYFKKTKKNDLAEHPSLFFYREGRRHKNIK